MDEVRKASDSERYKALNTEYLSDKNIPPI